MRRFTAMTVVALGVLALSGQARAAVTVSSADQLFWLGEETTMKIQNYESAFTNAWDTTGDQVADPSSWTATNAIGVGTYLRGIFNITTTYGDAGSSGTDRTPDGNVFELTGEFSTVVSAIVPLSATTAAFELVPDATFEAKYGAGAMVAMFEDATVDYTGVGTLATSHGSAVNGSLYMVLGAPGSQVWGTDYYWAATGATTPGVANFAASLALLTNNSGIASANILPITTQDPPTAAPGSFTNQAGLNSILNEFGLQGNTVGNTVANSPWALSSQDPLRVVAVPVPAAVWPGAMLLGLVGLRKIRRTAVN